MTASILKMLLVLLVCLTLHCVELVQGQECVQGGNCKLPDCFCPTYDHPLGKDNVPQIVYFGFDDAVQPQVSGYYNELFTEDRKNPNGCPITMTLYVSDQYTQYNLVSDYYKRGMEIGVHSVTHTDIDTPDKLRKEAAEQKDNIVSKAGVPAEKVLGWRSPNLKTVGDDQPTILGELKYLYDISLTYSRDSNYPWPYTLDFGDPYPCTIEPCPGSSTPHKGFWEVMVHSFTDPATGLPCGYVDGCRPQGEDAALEYLWSNFLKPYETTRAPFGLNMHAAWFAFPEYMRAMGRFIDRLLKTQDVYIVNVQQMLDWMRDPVPVKDIKTFAPWSCDGSLRKIANTPPPTLVAATTTRQHINAIGRGNRGGEQIKAPTRGRGLLFGRQQSNSQSGQKGVINSGQSTLNLSWYRPSRQNNPLLSMHVQPSIKTVTAPPRRISSPHPTQSGRMPIFWLPLQKESDIRSDQSHDVTGCIQEVNCMLPQCYCRTPHPPLDVPHSEIPQIVYITIDSRVDGRTFVPLMQVFSDSRKNPNGCPISATLFIPATGSYPPYISMLKAKGLSIGIRAGTFAAHFSQAGPGEEVLREIAGARSRLAAVYGWRGFASMMPSDDVFKTLHAKNVAFDSSIIAKSTDMSWPYTLDFGLRDSCAIMSSRCPSGRYPGMWEVPIKPLLVRNQTETCSFLDTCHTGVDTEQQVANILMENFKRHYTSRKTPFGINLHSTWLNGGRGTASLRGLMKFLDEILQLRDVTVVSIEQMLKWIKSPSKRIDNFPC